MTLRWRRAAVQAAVFGLEGCWLYVALLYVDRLVDDGSVLSATWLWSLYPTSWLLRRCLGALSWRRSYLLALSGVLAAAAALLFIKADLYGAYPFFDASWIRSSLAAVAGIYRGLGPETVVLVGTAILWWRGWSVAAGRVSFARVASEFQFGIALLLLLLLAAALTETALGRALAFVVGFFALGLIGVALARAEEAEQGTRGAERRHWAGLLMVATALVLVVGIVAGSSVTADVLELFLVPLKWLWWLVMKVLTFIAHFVSPAASTPAATPPLPTMPQTPPDADIPWALPETMRSILRFMVVGVGLLVFFLALWRVTGQMWGWLRRSRGPEAGRTVERIPGAFRADLLHLLRFLVRRLLGLRAWAWLGLPVRVESSDFGAGTASIRRVYRDLLRRGEASGWPRHRSQTAHEYLDVLEGLVPGRRGDLALITEAYAAARYGPVAPTGEEIQQTKETWRALKKRWPRGKKRPRAAALAPATVPART